jgi:hypothetical protein
MLLFAFKMRVSNFQIDSKMRISNIQLKIFAHCDEMTHPIRMPLESILTGAGEGFVRGLGKLWANQKSESSLIFFNPSTTLFAYSQIVGMKHPQSEIQNHLYA